MKKYLLFILLLFSITGGATNSDAPIKNTNNKSQYGLYGLFGLVGILGMCPMYHIYKHSKKKKTEDSDLHFSKPKGHISIDDYKQLKNDIISINKKLRSLEDTSINIEKYIKDMINHEMDIFTELNKREQDKETLSLNTFTQDSVKQDGYTEHITKETESKKLTTSKVFDLYHIGTPSENKPISIMSKEFKQRDHYYEIEIDQLDPMNALFRISSLANINRMMGQPDNYITPACECNSTNFDTGKKIQTIKDGKLQKRGNEWFLVEKSIIQII